MLRYIITNAGQEYVFMYFVRCVTHITFYSYVDYIKSEYIWIYTFKYICISIYKIKDSGQEYLFLYFVCSVTNLTFYSNVEYQIE